MEKLKEEIKDLHKLHSVTKDFNHIIEYQEGSWKMFEPSKFIYSYFTFNTLYSYDWFKTIEEKKLTIHQETLIDEQKYKKMFDFVFEDQSNMKCPDFIEILLLSNKKKVPNTKESLISELRHITPDNNISESTCNDFKKAFEKLVNTETILIGKLKNELLRFIYLVRNNIFHGTKDIIQMTGSGQRARLEIYSSFLIATNNLLFKALERKLNFKLDTKYKIRL